MKGLVMPNATFIYDDLFIDTPRLREREWRGEEILRQQLLADIARVRAELFTHQPQGSPVFLTTSWDGYPRTKTVPEKIKEMWERSSYYKMMKTREAYLIKPKRNNKPFYRAFERW